MSKQSNNKKSLAPKIRAILEEVFGKEMTHRLMVGSCNILSVDEDELYDENFDKFVMRMETVIPALVGRAGEPVIKRLWSLKYGSSA